MTIIVKNPLLSLILPCRSRDQIPNLQQSGMCAFCCGLSDSDFISF